MSRKNSITLGLWFAVVWLLAGPSVPFERLSRASEQSRTPTIESLKSLRPGHPRLYVPEGGLSGLKAEMEKDPLLRTWYAKLQEQARAMVTEPPVEYKLIGPRLLTQSRNALRRISTLAVLYRLDGDERKAARARAEMLTAAAFPDWNPSHFLDVAEMTHALAVGYDWLFNYLSPEDRRIIRAAIVEKGLKPGQQAYAHEAWWTKTHNNWSQVCNGGMTLGALAIAEAEPELAGEIIDKARASIATAMRQFAPDGGCEEGPGYWNYATRYTVYYLAGLQSALGTDFGYRKAPGFSETGLFRIQSTSPLGRVFNYADAGEGAGTAAQMLWLARAFNRPLYARHERRMAADRPDLFHLLWSTGREDAPPTAAPPLDVLFRGVDVAFFRSAWEDTRAVYVGFKGGDNHASHSHLDLGTFVLDALGERWAVDLGPDDYDLPAYFGAKRWTYYRLRTEGHNTLTIDGENQNPSGKAPVVAFLSTPKRAFAVADLTAGYQPRLTRAMRGIALLDRQQVLVQDEIQAPQPVDILWNCHTRAAIEITRDRAVLSQGGTQMIVRILSPAGARFDVVSANPGPPQASQPDVRNLVVRLPGKAKQTRLAVLLAPAGSGQTPALEPLAAWVAAGSAKR